MDNQTYIGLIICGALQVVCHGVYVVSVLKFQADANPLICKRFSGIKDGECFYKRWYAVRARPEAGSENDGETHATLEANGTRYIHMI